MQVTVETVLMSVSEVARKLRVSDETVRRLFSDEADVIVIAASSKKKRRYETLRIPAEVYLRVLTRLKRAA